MPYITAPANCIRDGLLELVEEAGLHDHDLTDLGNMVVLCRRHHTKLHLGEYTIRMVGGRPVLDTGEQQSVRAGPGPGRSPGATPAPAKLDAVANPDRARRSGEHLTFYALDVLVTDLLLTAA